MIHDANIVYNTNMYKESSEKFTNISDQVKQFIDYKKVSINKFSTVVGVSSSYFNKMLAKSSSVGSFIMQKILRGYPEINPSWLLTGEGPMLREEKKGGYQEKKGEPAIARESTGAGVYGKGEKSGKEPQKEEEDDGKITYKEYVEIRKARVMELEKLFDEHPENAREIIRELSRMVLELSDKTLECFHKNQMLIEGINKINRFIF